MATSRTADRPSLSPICFAAELGYEVTVVKDATADYSDEEMHAALDINIPNYVQTLGISAL